MTTQDVACEIVEVVGSNSFNAISTEYYARVPMQGEYVEYEENGEVKRDRVITVIHTDQSTEKARLVVRQSRSRHTH